MGRKIVSPIVFSIFVLASLFSGIAHADWVDGGFNPAANSSVLSLVMQADGKILEGGNFLDYRRSGEKPYSPAQCRRLSGCNLDSRQ